MAKKDELSQPNDNVLRWVLWIFVWAVAFGISWALIAHDGLMLVLVIWVIVAVIYIPWRLTKEKSFSKKS
jgi:hypothetical protein